MPLTLSPQGEKVKIRRISGKDETRRFLANLGFVEGETVTIVTEIDGNMIINVKDSRVALGKEMAAKIQV